MGYEQIVSLVSTVAFPIAMCLLMCFYVLSYRNNTKQKAINLTTPCRMLSWYLNNLKLFLKEGDSDMSFKISVEGINLIKSFEGLRLNAYKVSPRDKYYTIGYGHYGADVTKNMKITEVIATELLKEDLAKAEKHVNSYDKKYHWTQNEYDALVSFAYNVGNIHQLTAFGTRDKKTIANKMLQYTKSNGTVLQGLVRRRTKEQKLFLTPVSVSYETIAKEVIAGKWGNGSARRKALTKAGYNATLVQQLVNEMLRKI